MSKSAGEKPKEKSDKTKADNFVWTDDEVQLLLEVTNDYKVSKAAKNIDWESCQSKYTDILELYREHYPSSQEESSSARLYSESLLIRKFSFQSSGITT